MNRSNLRLEEISLFELENDPIFETDLVSLYPYEEQNRIIKSRFYNLLSNFEEMDYLLNRFYITEFGRLVLNKEYDSMEIFYRDGGRNAILPKYKIIINDDEFFVSKRGVGGYYSLLNVTSHTQRVKYAVNKLLSKGIEKSLLFSSEDMGYDRPFGFQDLGLGRLELQNSNRIKDDFTFCNAFFAPVISLVYVPKEVKTVAHEIRLFEKIFDSSKKPLSKKRFKPVQLTRLVPSNIRPVSLYDKTLADELGLPFVDDGKKFREKYNLENSYDAKRFIKNFVSSYAALLSLPARVDCSEGKDYYSFFVFDNVLISKDSVISKSGNLYFLDLEGVNLFGESPFIYLSRKEVRKEMMGQIKMNLLPLKFFDKLFSFALDENIDKEQSIYYLRKYFNLKQNAISIIDEKKPMIYVNGLYDIEIAIELE